jgi:cobalamin biosynthesis protein CobD/CbiB
MDIREWLSVDSNTVFCVLAAWLIEMVVGKPRFVPRATGWIGYFARAAGQRLFAAVERHCANKPSGADACRQWAGAALSLYVALFAFVLTSVLLDFARQAHAAVYTMLNIYCLYSALSARSLADKAWRARGRLLAAAGRDRRIAAATAAVRDKHRAAAAPPRGKRLAEATPPAAKPPEANADACGRGAARRERMCRLAIENIASKAVPSVVAPMLCITAGALIGIPAAIAAVYASICALRGLRVAGNAPYGSAERFGKFSAGAYAAANYIPTRVFCMLAPTLAMLCGKGVAGYRHCAKIIRRDGGNSFDPNGALSMSAYAGALRVRLGAGNWDMHGGSPNAGNGSKRDAAPRAGSKDKHGGSAGAGTGSRGENSDSPQAWDWDKLDMLAVGDDDHAPDEADVAFAVKLTVAASACLAICGAAVLLLFLK